MQAASGIASWAVRPDSPFKSFADAVAAAQARPGQITISTSGAGGQWHELAALIARYAGIELRYVPYGSGQLATLAGLSGEVDIAGGGVHEHVQFVDAGQLVSLQQASSADIVTPSGRRMPTLAHILPAIAAELPLGGPYNLGMRREVPIEVIREIEAAFLVAARSDAFREIARRHYLSIDTRVGGEADRRAAELEVEAARLFAELKIPGARPAADLGLPAPEAFADWWPPDGYRPLAE
jgi:tripartite-type tricarboxylate transporter receptor subunit TctC